MRQQIARRGLVLREGPQAEEIRPHRHHAAFWPARIGEGPAIRCNLRRIAFGHRPGRGRVPDHRRPAGDQRPVIGRVIIADRIGRQERRHPLGIFQRRPHIVGIDRDVALAIHQVGPERPECRAPGLIRSRSSCRNRSRTETRPYGRRRRLSAGFHKSIPPMSPASPHAPGNHACTSIPAYCFSMLIRAHGVSGAEPQATGTARQCPSDTPRYS